MYIIKIWSPDWFVKGQLNSLISSPLWFCSTSYRDIHISPTRCCLSLTDMTATKFVNNLKKEINKPEKIQAPNLQPLLRLAFEQHLYRWQEPVALQRLRLLLVPPQTLSRCKEKNKIQKGENKRMRVTKVSLYKVARQNLAVVSRSWDPLSSDLANLLPRRRSLNAIFRLFPGLFAGAA